MAILRRRFYKVQYIVLTALFFSSLYLLTGKNEKLNVKEPVQLPQQVKFNFLQLLFHFDLSF